MRGSIQKKGKVYYAVLAVNGKRKWIKGGPATKDAQRVLNENLGEIEAGTYKDLPKIAFSQFTEIWLRDYAGNQLKGFNKTSL